MPPTAPQPHKSSNAVLTSVITVVIIAAIIFAIVKYSSSTTPTTPVVTTPADTTGTPADTSTSTIPTTVPPVTKPSVSAYKDGTYSADGHYVSPGGAQTLHVTLTLTNDVVTAATVTDGSIDPESRHYQQIFIASYKSQVVGKDISTLNLSKVSGSSLTPGGFDDAVAKIKIAAKA
jgi:hypothetical protein